MPLVSKKGKIKEISCLMSSLLGWNWKLLLEPPDVLCRKFKKTNIEVYGLDPDPDWIRMIQIQ
jgi:hypothetical protein